MKIKPSVIGSVFCVVLFLLFLSIVTPKNEIEVTSSSSHISIVHQDTVSHGDKPSVTAKAFTTPRPTDAAKPSVTPRPTVTEKPVATPRPTVTAKPSATPRPTVTAKPSVTPRPTVTAKPSATPRPTVAAKPSATPRPTVTAYIIRNERSYILNTNTHKFHYPDCRSVKQMKEKNKRPYTGTRNEVIAMGYDPCGNCHP